MRIPTVLATSLLLLVATAGTLPLAAATEPLEPGVSTSGTHLNLGSGSGRQRYIVEVTGGAVPTRSSGTSAAQATAAARADQAQALSGIRDTIDRPVSIGRRWTRALNGFTVSLTAAEASQVAALPEVAGVIVDESYELDTDVSTEAMGATAVWDGTGGLPGVKGEGMVIGIIDSGINPSNPQFAASVPVSAGGDGHVVTNPRGRHYGMCDSDNTAQYEESFACTDKLIGAYDFDGDPDVFDGVAHGTHVAATAAGNRITAPDGAFAGRTVTGVAPHANLIAYDVCNNDEDGGCYSSMTLSAIEQAIADDVDVLNYSISSANVSPWFNLVSRAYLNARASGISVATSAGNSGFNQHPLTSVAASPWLTSVANLQRPGRNSVLVDLSGPGSAYLPEMSGLSGGGSMAAAAPIVRGTAASTTGSYAFCRADMLDPAKVAGKIVVCDRGGTDPTGVSLSRVSKAEAVLAKGGVGVILVDVNTTQTPVADPYALPGVHLTMAQGNSLKSWLATAPAASGRIAESATSIDFLNATSSRGANSHTDTIAPTVAAPGTTILAAGGVGDPAGGTWQEMTGTSMASPHVAGSLALLAQLHPTWTPAELQSALSSTAVPGVRDSDNKPATAHMTGVGALDVSRAARAGLLFDVDIDDYMAAEDDSSTLNLPSMARNRCADSCSWTRTATANTDGVWTASVEGKTSGLTVSLPTDTWSLTAGAELNLSVSASTATLPINTWGYATILLRHADPSVPAVRLPLAVRASATEGSYEPELITRRDAASARLDGLGVRPGIGLANSALVAGTSSRWTAAPGGYAHTQTSVTNNTMGLYVEATTDSDADLSLYVGTGAAVTDANVRCSSEANTGQDDDSTQGCVVVVPAAGTYWIRVHNNSPAGAEPAVVDITTYKAGAANGSMTAAHELRDGDVRSDARLGWDVGATPAERRFGLLQFGAAATAQYGIVFVNRDGDDATLSSPDAAAYAGEQVRHGLTLRPEPQARASSYTVVETLPVGLTYVPGSATAGGTYDDAARTVTWTGTTADLAAAAGPTPGSTSDSAQLSFRSTVDVGTEAGTELVRSLTHSTTLPGTRPATTISRWPVRAERLGARVTLSTPTTSPTTADPVTVTADVRDLDGVALNTGEAIFSVDGTEVGRVPVADGQAIVALNAFTTPGTRVVTVAFASDTHRLPEPASLTLEVKAPPGPVVPGTPGGDGSGGSGSGGSSGTGGSDTGGSGTGGNDSGGSGSGGSGSGGGTSTPPGSSLTPAKSTLKAKAPARTRVGTRPKIRITLTAASRPVSGKVTLKVKVGAKAYTRVVSVKNGRASLRLAKLRSPGKATITLAWAGDSASSAAKGKTKIVVRR